MANALIECRRQLRSGATHERALAAAKVHASFSGPMRANLVSMLDDIGVARLLDLTTTAALWADRSNLVHFTSALRYPVFVDGKNYSGSPSMLRVPFLRDQLETWLGEEMRRLPHALFVPLGPKVGEALDYLAPRIGIGQEQVLTGLPHPSGASGERIAYFLGRKPRERLSAKTNAARLDAARSELVAKIERLEGVTMGQMKPREMDLEQRIAEFTAGYDYDNDAAVTLVELVRSAGDFLEKIVGTRRVDAGMKRVIGPLAGGERHDLARGSRGRGERRVHRMAAGSNAPRPERLCATTGSTSPSREHEDERQVADRLQEMVETADAFLRICPLDAWLGEERSPQLETTVLLARNRWALDHDRPVEPEASGGLRRRQDELQGKWLTNRKPGEARPIDAVLATNMLSVGVDVNRLGVMVVNGQPKGTAEYIQATSRVGRTPPGLVATVLTWARPRDLSHYETFEHYHATFYQHVEAQSVTPFSPRALDRGLTGAMLSIMRHTYDAFAANDGAGAMNSPSRKEMLETIGAIAARTWEVTEDSGKKALTEAEMKSRADEWANEAGVGGRTLVYQKHGAGPTAYPLLSAPGIKPWTDWTVPMSMREVEPGVRLVMEDDRSISDPTWRPRVTQPEEDQQ